MHSTYRAHGVSDQLAAGGNDNYSPPARVGALAEAATREARNIAEFGGSWADPDLERARREFFGEAL